MKNYADKTDQQINELVAMANGLNVQERSIIGIGRIPVVVKLFCGVEDLTSVPDYCNNWADAGPVMFENKISLLWDETNGVCKAAVASMFDVNTCRINGVSHANPLRAAMIVFLMMKDAEK